MSGPALGACLDALYPGTPMLFMSSYSDEEIVDQSAVETYHPLLRKPFTEAALAAAIATILEVNATLGGGS